MRLAEAAVFGALALGMHLAAFALIAAPAAGTQGAGAGGQDRMTLAPASAQLAALVQDWTRPPEAATRNRPAPRAPAAAPDFSPPEVPRDDAPMMHAPQAMQAPDMPARPDASVGKMPPPPKPRPRVRAAGPSHAAAEASRKHPDSRPEKRQDRSGHGNRTSAGQAAARAAGQGGGAVAGAGGQAAAATGDGGAASMQAAWGVAIATSIERHKRYPRSAGGATGKVGVALSVGVDGQLLGVRVTRGSGNDALDAAALQAVRAAAPFAHAPRAMAAARYGFSFTMDFRR